MNHAAGNRSPAELRMRGAKHLHKGLLGSAEVLWRSCRRKQSIRPFYHNYTQGFMVLHCPHPAACAPSLQTLPLLLLSDWSSFTFPPGPPSSSSSSTSSTARPRVQLLPLSVVLHLPSILISLALLPVAGCMFCTQIHVHSRRQMNVAVHHTVLQIVGRG